METTPIASTDNNKEATVDMQETVRALMPVLKNMRDIKIDHINVTTLRINTVSSKGQKFFQTSIALLIHGKLLGENIEKSSSDWQSVYTLLIQYFSGLNVTSTL